MFYEVETPFGDIKTMTEQQIKELYENLTRFKYENISKARIELLSFSVIIRGDNL